MVELDGDNIRISSRGKMAERDIVQVRFGSLCLLVVYDYKRLTIILMLFNFAQRLKADKIQPSGPGPAPDKHFHSFGKSVAALNTEKGLVLYFCTIFQCNNEKQI